MVRQVKYPRQIFPRWNEDTFIMMGVRFDYSDCELEISTVLGLVLLAYWSTSMLDAMDDRIYVGLGT